MRKRLFGTIAAAAVGSGGLFGQSPEPPPPAAIAPAGAYSDPIPPGGFGPGDPSQGMPMMGMPGMGMPGMGMPGMGGPMMGDPGFGGPMPPPGLHGQQHWESPEPPKLDALASRAAPRIWTTADYLLYFTKSQPLNTPLVTTSAPADGGIVGRPTTTVLHPQGDLGYGLLSGFRVGVGMFCDDCRRFGFEINGFATEQKANTYFTGTDMTGQPLLGRPFINAGSGDQDVLLVSFPTFASGEVSAYSRTRAWGAEGGPVTNIFRSNPDAGYVWNLNLHTGFRFVQVDEQLMLAQSSTLLNNATAPFDGKQYAAPASIEVRDMFSTINDFYGGQVGLSSELRSGRMMFSVTGKFAAGLMHQRINVHGTSALSDPTRMLASQVFGGLYANPSNMGKYNNDEFAIMPEVNKIGRAHV